LLSGFDGRGGVIRLKTAKPALACLLFIVSLNLFASPNFVTLSPLSQATDSANYGLSIADCHLLDEIQILAGNFNQTNIADYNSADNTCEFNFVADGAGFNRPEARLVDKLGNVQTFTEQFDFETQRPELSEAAISIVSVLPMPVVASRSTVPAVMSVVASDVASLILPA
jgi:hypothetical protein